MNVLEINNVTKRFGNLVAVRDVSLSVGKGELLRHHRAERRRQDHVLQPDQRLSFRRHRARSFSTAATSPSLRPHERVVRGMARTFQITEIFPELTVFENVRIATEVSSGYRLRPWINRSEVAKVHRHVEEMLKLVALEAKRDRLVGELSHGDQRAAEIAMALALKPHLLLLDEPTAGMGDQETYQITQLDPEAASRQQLYDCADRARHARGVSSRRPHLRARPGPHAGARARRRRSPPTRPFRPPIWATPHDRRPRQPKACTPITARATSCTGSASRSPRAGSPRCSAATAPARPRRCAA